MRYPLIFFISAILCGCAVTNMVKWNFYLSNEKYQAGIRSFSGQIKKYPDDHRLHYYLGRFYLAENQTGNGIEYLKKAIRLKPDLAEYHFWLGVAYSGNKDRKREWMSYEKALELNPGHLKSRVYLAHTQMERKQYLKALDNYTMVLRNAPDEPASLYNRAMILRILRRTGEEKRAWKEYLDFYPSGPMGRRAANQLNRLGDFSYRNHLIGSRTITLRKIQFVPFTAELTREDQVTLDFLGEMLALSPSVAIHIVAYQKNNKKLAEKRAKSIKKYLLKNFRSIQTGRLKVSWFGVSERIRKRKARHYEHESINFITAL